MLSDRIGVMYQGHLVGIVENGARCRTCKVGMLMTGARSRPHERRSRLALPQDRTSPEASPARGRRPGAVCLIPVLLALMVGGVILLVLGKDPLTYYGYVVQARACLSWGGSQETLDPHGAPAADRGRASSSPSAPASGISAATDSSCWRRSSPAALAPALIETCRAGPRPCVALHDASRSAAGALWSLIPAILKARYGINEIITSLMMSFLGTQLRQCAGEAASSAIPPPRCRRPRTLPVEDRLPRIFGDDHPCRHPDRAGRRRSWCI